MLYEVLVMRLSPGVEEKGQDIFQAPELLRRERTR